MSFARYRSISVALSLATSLLLGCGSDDGGEDPGIGHDDGSEVPSTGGTGTDGPDDDGNGALPGGDAGAGRDDGNGDDTASDASGAPAKGEDQGVGDGHDVILIGDSWMNLNGVSGIQQSVAKAASGKGYRPFGVPGTRMLDNVIPMQYQAAKTQNADIKTVIMTGGGNDVLMDPLVLADCLMVGQACKDRVEQVGALYEKMAGELAADGVQDVVIVLYTRGTLLGAKVIDHIWAKMTPICDNAPVRCHLVDPDQLGAGTMKTRDGIHPTDEGYDLIGKSVYERMEKEGMRR